MSLSLAESPWGREVGRTHTKIKRRILRFGFGVLELRKLYGLSKTKQRGRLMGVSYIAIIGSWSVIHTAGEPR